MCCIMGMEARVVMGGWNSVGFLRIFLVPFRIFLILFDGCVCHKLLKGHIITFLVRVPCSLTSVSIILM